MIHDGDRDAKARRALMTGLREVRRLLEAGYERRRRGVDSSSGAIGTAVNNPPASASSPRAS
jgi:hypothetical protein